MKINYPEGTIVPEHILEFADRKSEQRHAKNRIKECIRHLRWLRWFGKRNTTDIIIKCWGCKNEPSLKELLRNKEETFTAELITAKKQFYRSRTV